MKTKFTYIILAVALICAAGCQDESLLTEKDSDMLSFSVLYADSHSKGQTRSSVEFTDEDGNLAPFNISLSVEDTKVATPQTRGVPVNNLAKFTETFDAFRAWGWTKSGTNWTNVWESGAGTKIKQVEPNSTEYRPVNGSDEFIKAYDAAAVAGGQYRFYALAPYDLSGTGVTSPSCTYNQLSFNYTMPGGAGESDDAENQKEVLAGYMASGAKLTKNVPLTFTPVLAAIQFRVGKDVNHNFKIKSIELKNFYYTGSCTVNPSAAPIVKWTVDESTKKTFKQTFGDDGNGQEILTTTTEGTVINAEDLSKTFFVIPQTCSSETEEGSGGELELKGAMIIVNYTEKDEHGVEGTEQSAQHLVFGTEFEAGKTYIYNIGKFDDDPGDLQPWVEFCDFSVNDAQLLGRKNSIHQENNSKFIFDFAQQNNTAEKAYFKIYNLTPGRWYSITFSERLSLYTWERERYNGKYYYSNTGNASSDKIFGQPGCYACRVCRLDEKNTANYQQSASQLIHEKFLQPNTFIWEHPKDVYQNQDYVPISEPAKLTFYAEESTMLWTWDYSKGADSHILRAEIYLEGDKIEDITPEERAPTVDFLSATLHNFSNETAWSSYSSMKMYAVDATAGSRPVSGELRFRVVNPNTGAGRGKLGRLNIPLTNLDPSKWYKLTYTVKKDVGTHRTGQNFGFVIQDSEITGNTPFNGVIGYKSYNGTSYDAATFEIISEEYTFKPSTDTMYWIWDFSNFGVGNDAHQFVTFKDVKIEVEDDPTP